MFKKLHQLKLKATAKITGKRYLTPEETEKVAKDLDEFNGHIRNLMSEQARELAFYDEQQIALAYAKHTARIPEVYAFSKAIRDFLSQEIRDENGEKIEENWVPTKKELYNNFMPLKIGPLNPTKNLSPDEYMSIMDKYYDHRNHIISLMDNEKMSRLWTIDEKRVAIEFAILGFLYLVDIKGDPLPAFYPTWDYGDMKHGYVQYRPLNNLGANSFDDDISIEEYMYNIQDAIWKLHKKQGTLSTLRDVGDHNIMFYEELFHNIQSIVVAYTEDEVKEVFALCKDIHKFAKEHRYTETEDEQEEFLKSLLGEEMNMQGGMIPKGWTDSKEKAALFDVKFSLYSMNGADYRKAVHMFFDHPLIHKEQLFHFSDEVFKYDEPNAHAVTWTNDYAKLINREVKKSFPPMPKNYQPQKSEKDAFYTYMKTNVHVKSSMAKATTSTAKSKVKSKAATATATAKAKATATKATATVMAKSAAKPTATTKPAAAKSRPKTTVATKASTVKSTTAKTTTTAAKPKVAKTKSATEKPVKE